MYCIINKFRRIISIYNKITNINNISIVYNIKKNDNFIKLFGEKFVNNNIDKCKIIINNKEYKICENFYLKNNNVNKLNVKLKGIKNITDMSYMFHGCKSLIELPDLAEWNISDITDMSYMFYDCELLSSLPDISKWNFINVKNISYMFSSCSSLQSLPNISKWNTENVTSMSYMFCQCISLQSLPDISKWNTEKVTKMSYMFSSCRSLQSLPDISKWKLNKELKKEDMFKGVNINIIPKKFK